MNPNLCTICELMFKVVMRRRNIQAELTILFADLRGYTALSQTLGAGQVHELLNVFYDECAGGDLGARRAAEQDDRRRGPGDLQFPDHPLRPCAPGRGRGSRTPRALRGA